MLMILIFAVTAMLDPIHLVFGLGAGAIAPNRQFAIATVPVLTMLSVALTNSLAGGLHQHMSDSQLTIIAISRLIAFTALFFIAYEGKQWLRRQG